MAVMNAETVLTQLARAASQDSNILKPAELQLGQWQTQPGFYSAVLAVCSDHSLDTNVRWLAALYFKNGIDRYWRKAAPNAISDEEKSRLRAKLITNLNEPVSQIATQLAVMIGKIARVDCPQPWTDLVSTLLSAVRADNSLVQERAMLIFYHVIKTLAQRRLPADRRMFEGLSSHIFSFVVEMWNANTDSFLQEVVQRGENAAKLLERSSMSLKVLRKLLIYGIKQFSSLRECVQFIGSIFDRLKVILEIRLSLTESFYRQERVEKYIVLHTKILLDSLEQHALNYTEFIPQTLQFAAFYAFTDAGKQFRFERFSVNCLNMVKIICTCTDYRPARNIEDTRNPETVAAHQHKLDFFTSSNLSEVCQRIVSDYFLLTPSDLQLWQEDPEDYAMDSGGESWKYQIRPCVEALFLSLFHEYRETLIPVLLQMMQNNGRTEPTDLKSVLRKEALYHAMGMACYDIFEDVDFDSWLQNTLLEELKVPHSNYNIIRRRVLWLIGQWVNVRLAPELRPVVYEAVLRLLTDEQDLVVRLSAATTLRCAIDDFEFNTEQFLPYLETSFSLLFNLLKQCLECDSKMEVLQVLSFMINRVGAHVLPHAAALIQYLPQLWEDSAEYYMLRSAIVSNLIHLVSGLGDKSSQMYNFLLPVIQLSTDLNQDAHIYLVEDGVELWLVVLHNACANNADCLLQIYPNMHPLLMHSTEHMKECMKIINAYILLAPRQFLQHFGTELVQLLNDKMSDLQADGVVLILKLTERVLKIFPEEGCTLFKPILIRVYKAVLDNEDYPVVLAMHLSIVARILLQNRVFFLSSLTKLYGELGQQSADSFLVNLLFVWLDKINVITQPARRKLSGLSLASLLTYSCSHAAVQHYVSIITNCVCILNDICVERDGIQVDSLVVTKDEVGNKRLSDSGGENEFNDTEHDRRKHDLAISDPVHQVSLREYFVSQLKTFHLNVGNEHFNSLMANIDEETQSELQLYTD